MQTKTLQQNTKLIYPLIKQQERILIWKKIKGMWANHLQNPIDELNKIRNEWD